MHIASTEASRFRAECAPAWIEGDLEKANQAW